MTKKSENFYPKMFQYPHNIDLNIINFDNNFNEDDPDTIILIKLLVWHIKFEKCKALTKI